MRTIKAMITEDHPLKIIRIGQEQLTAGKDSMMDLDTKPMTTKTPQRTFAPLLMLQVHINLAPASKVLKPQVA